MANNVSTLSVLLAGVASAAIVFTIYLVSTRCNRRLTTTTIPSPPPRPQELQSPFIYGHGTTRGSLEKSMVDLLPVHKYHKDLGLVGDDDNMCVVCLSEFEEGEELCTLPHCMHSFHAPCIDMWLNSHKNCPLCRAPSPLMLSDMPQGLQISPNVLTQSPSS